LKSQLRIFHGPYNVAGIGGHLAEAERERGYASKFIVYKANKLIHNHDDNIDFTNNHLFKRFIHVPFYFFWKCVFNFDLFHFYFGKSLLMFNLDLPILRLFGKKIIMTYCGSEVRLVGKVESKRNPYVKHIQFSTSSTTKKIWASNFFLIQWIKWIFLFQYDIPKYDTRKQMMMWWQNLFIHKFFAYRDLYASVLTVIPKEKVIKDVFINNIGIASSEKLKFEEPKQNEKVVIVHAPTNKLGKGTAFIEKSLEELKKRGVEFEYLEIYRMSHPEVLGLLKDKADIVIDQVLVGSFASLAIEAMYFGKPVVCYILKDIENEFHGDLPIYNSNLDNLTDNLQELVVNRDLRISIGKKGIKYLNKYYNKGKIIDETINIYKSLYY